MEAPKGAPGLELGDFERFKYNGTRIGVDQVHQPGGEADIAFELPHFLFDHERVDDAIAVAEPFELVHGMPRREVFYVYDIVLVER